ncbi:hypothetical protein [Alteromonas mediterranea]|uniref:hypothetical protein n=1 Tax=Alteromonas mediterranea TaxID=314275 RepID=UPI0012FC5CF1|nr:hypothetical protein [Alteromonas mediterranea]QGX62061.1 hypothetical protein FJN15_09980 [Alteromonas mediterranea]
MDSFKYEVKTVGGVFKLRSTKLTELEELCVDMGNKDWELVSVNYDWLMVSYTLFFRKKVLN